MKAWLIEPLVRPHRIAKKEITATNNTSGIRHQKGSYREGFKSIEHPSLYEPLLLERYLLGNIFTGINSIGFKNFIHIMFLEFIKQSVQTIL